MDKSRNPQELFGEPSPPQSSKHLQLQNLILAPKSISDTTITSISTSTTRQSTAVPKMFSRTVRAVSCRALAGSVRPVAAPVSRQIAPLVAQPQRRQYHEKVLDRASLSASRDFLNQNLANISRDRLLPPAERRHIRQVGQLGGRGIGGSAGVRRCDAAPHQGRPGDTSHQRRAVQDVWMWLCDVSLPSRGCSAASQYCLLTQP